jgi:CO/xanthine dehydrogenase Mo-binding subunit
VNQRDPKLHAAQGLLVVGKDVPRTDALSKVTGAAQYVADLHLPGLLQAAVLRSPHPHARIVSIDISAAVAMRGVKAVITGANTAAKKWGCFRPDLYPLAIDKVRYVGDEVAAVAARDAATARAAVDAIKVEYEVLPAVLSMDEALAPGAPRVHDDAEGNVAHQFSFERGDVDDGFAASDVVVEGTWESSRQWHTSLETIGCVAPVGGRSRLDVVQYADAVPRARTLCDRARCSGKQGARHTDGSRRRIRRQIRR